MTTLALAVLVAAAEAHPMGTLSTNRSALLTVRDDAVEVRYVVDFAEVPSVAEGARVAADPGGYAGAPGAELAGNDVAARGGPRRDRRRRPGDVRSSGTRSRRSRRADRPSGRLGVVRAGGAAVRDGPRRGPCAVAGARQDGGGGVPGRVARDGRAGA